MAIGRMTAQFAVALAVTLVPAAVRAQQASAAPVLKIGSIAPNFSLPGASRYGLLQKPVTLSDYRGQTVVLAFFYQARTKG